MTERRRFSGSERAALYLAADGRCAECGEPLEPGWHADHMNPYIAGGSTDVINGQALCPYHNLHKGARVLDPRDRWQRQMQEEWLATRPSDALIVATPGAGKTIGSLKLAKILLAEQAVERIAVIVHTDFLREQWADVAARQGLDLKPVTDISDYEKEGFVGCVATYQQLAVGAGADLMRRTMRRPTLLIADEIHHAGDDRSWGDKLRHAIEPATFRVLLSGTPWRRDQKQPIPFVEYNQRGDGVWVPVAFYAYEYGQAVGDGVCRRIEFHAYDGEARWIDVGEIHEAQLGEELNDDDIAAVFDAVLDPRRPWMPGLLSKAALALDDLRRDVPRAGGLVIADTQDMAEAYATLLERITGERPALAISRDGQKAKADIEAFKNGNTHWLVSVRMVSEGVDIPRLAVGVYATRTRTPLFFRQVVGRFVRINQPGDYNAQLFIPSVPALLRHAREIEDELRHELDLAEEQERLERQLSEDGQQTLNLRQILSVTEAKFHSAVVAGEDLAPAEIDAARRECQRWDIPPQFAVSVARMLREHAAPIEVTVEPKPSEEPRHRVEKLRRQELESLTRRYAYASGTPFQEVNGRLYSLYGPRKQATLESLEEQIQLVTQWIKEL